MTNFNIQIISDTVCPWCYVGYKRLLKAITSHKTTYPNDTFTLNWHAFYLNPTSPTYPGIDKQEYYALKFGEARVGGLFARLAAAGEGEGIAFKFGGRTGKTRDSHRVIWYAGRKEHEEEGLKSEGGVGVQNRVVEELFRAYFEEERNITDRAVLVDAAVKAGFERAEMEKLLESEDGATEVDHEAERAQRQLVTGVPFFTVQGKYHVGGAEEPAAFLKIFDKVKRDA